MAEVQLNLGQTQGISNVTFAPSPNAGGGRDLLVSSWDGALSLYDVDANRCTTSFIAGEGAAPVLDCCFTDAAHAVSAGADRTVKLFDLASGESATLGTHKQPVKCAEYAALQGAVVSAGWDRALHLWDPRQRGGAAAATIELPDKAYTMGLSEGRIVVGMAGRHVYVYDLRNMVAEEQRRQSSLKYQTRCIRCFPNGSGYAVSSVEGRVAMEYFDEDPAVQARKYAFKCHRRREGDTDTVFPVNSLAFHKGQGTFATGGCDGVVMMWDGEHKKKLTQYPAKATSVASLAFSHDDALLATAVSYTHEAGEPAEAPPPDQIFVRTPSEQDVRARGAHRA